MQPPARRDGAPASAAGAAGDADASVTTTSSAEGAVTSKTPTLPGDRGARTWGNTISSWQFGIYRDPPTSIGSGRTSAVASAGSAWAGRAPGAGGRGGGRIRCCVAAAMAGVTALLVGVMVLDAAGTRNGESRDQEVVRRLLRLQAAGAPASPHPSLPALPTTSPSPSLPPSLSPPPPAAVLPTAAAAREPLQEADATLPTPPTPAPAPAASDRVDDDAPATDPAPAARSSDTHEDDEAEGAGEGGGEEDGDVPKAQAFFLAPARKQPPDVANGSRRRSYSSTPPPPPPRPFLRPPPPPRHSPSSPAKHRPPPPHAVPPSASAESRPYPQLSPYRYPTDARNIQDIIQYLTAGRGTGHAIPHSMGQQGPGRFFATPTHAIKFSGVYLNPRFEDAPPAGGVPGTGAGVASEDRPLRRLRRPNIPPSAATRNSLNGHAYIADPFHAFKPADPGQVNLLADSDLRFAPSDRHTPPARHPGGGVATDAYFPRPPLDFGAGSGGDGAATATTTIAPGPAPPGPLDITSAFYRPLGAASVTRGNGKRRTKPLSVMLDIYPMAPAEYAAAAAATITPRRPYHAAGMAPRAPGGGAAGAAAQAKAHHMVVHLNLFPRMRGGTRSNSRSDAEDPEGTGSDDTGPVFHVSVRPASAADGVDARKAIAGCDYDALDGSNSNSDVWARVLAELTSQTLEENDQHQNSITPREMQEEVSRRMEQVLSEMRGRGARARSAQWPRAATWPPAAEEHTGPAAPMLEHTAMDASASDDGPRHTAPGVSRVTTDTQGSAGAGARYGSLRHTAVGEHHDTLRHPGTGGGPASMESVEHTVLGEDNVLGRIEHTAMGGPDHTAFDIGHDVIEHTALGGVGQNDVEGPGHPNADKMANMNHNHIEHNSLGHKTLSGSKNTEHLPHLSFEDEPHGYSPSR